MGCSLGAGLWELGTHSGLGAGARAPPGTGFLHSRLNDAEGAACCQSLTMSQPPPALLLSPGLTSTASPALFEAMISLNILKAPAPEGWRGAAGGAPAAWGRSLPQAPSALSTSRTPAWVPLVSALVPSPWAPPGLRLPSPQPLRFFYSPPGGLRQRPPRWASWLTRPPG